MNVFDIIGPIMVGPSSSHTAGAVRIGLVTRHLLAQEPVSAVITLHGSFSATGLGHGTQKAIIAGLLGMSQDDMRIPQSDVIANEAGFKYQFEYKTIKDAHPNTALIQVVGKYGRELEVQASSIGGGRILVNKIDGIAVNFSGEQNTLIVHNIDQPGHVAEVTSTLSHKSVNIATMQLFRDSRGGYAVMVVETDQEIPNESIEWLNHLEGVIKVTYLSAVK
jgi:L-serine dehydratase